MYIRPFGGTLDREMYELLLYSCTRSLLFSTTHVHRGGGGAHPSMPEAGKARRGGELPADRGDLNSVVS